MSVNKVILVGNVGRNPDIRMIEGKTLATISLATTEPAQTTAAGNVITEHTEWHNLVLWGKNAEIAERYITKGARLYIEGKLRTRFWQDNNAIKRQITEILVDTLDILKR